MSSHGAARAGLGQGKRAGPFAAAIRCLQGKTLMLAAVVGLALTAVGAAALLTGEDAQQAPPGTPREASVAQLRALAEKADAPIYWAGTAPGTRFEVTETRGGKVFVRYLPPDVKVADKRAGFLTVGTYPYRRAYAVTDESSHQKGMARAPAPAGGLAVWSETRPSSVYVAYPGSDRLVEVFSPKASEARRLVLEGEVGPVGLEPTGAQVGPPLVPPSDLGP
jgi:hypothetical protein